MIELSHVEIRSANAPYSSRPLKLELHPDANGYYQFEYIDRENFNTVGLGTFEKIPEDSRHDYSQYVGRRIIAPTNLRDRTTHLPVIFTVTKLVEDARFQMMGHGLASIIADICFVETQ